MIKGEVVSAIDWELLAYAFATGEPPEYGYEEYLREYLEDSGFEEESIEKILSDVVTLRKIFSVIMQR